ncbi:MAG: hypothetical protein HY042_02750, partial [Spirochaetia bacterium]|nr:hypothetical protein [Spirochaetia bacterium]
GSNTLKRFWNPASLTRTVLGGGFLILLGALALSGRSQTAWAFSFQGGAGVGAVIGGLILLGAALYIQSRGNDVSIPGIETLFVLRPGKARWVVFAIPLALMAGVLLYVFRLRLFLNPPGGLGDSLQLVQHVPAYAHIFGYLDSFDEALDLYFHSKVYLWIEKSFHGTIVDAYAWPSIGAGVVFTLVVLRFLWGRPWAHMAAGFFLLYCNTALQLYAGYVENYTFASLILSSTLLFGGQLLERAQSDDLAAEERRNPVPVWPLSLLAVAAAVGVLFHLIVGAVLPGLVYVCWRQAGGRWTDFARRALIASVPALVILGAGWIFLFKLVANPLTISGSFASHPAILHPKKILTLAHTLNYVSLYLFAAPAAILVLLVLFGRSSSNNTQARRALFRTPAERFAGMTFAVLGTHAFVWNSMIGFSGAFEPPRLLRIHTSHREDSYTQDSHTGRRGSGLARVESLVAGAQLPRERRFARQSGKCAACLARRHRTCEPRYRLCRRAGFGAPSHLAQTRAVSRTRAPHHRTCPLVS